MKLFLYLRSKHYRILCFKAFVCVFKKNETIQLRQMKENKNQNDENHSSFEEMIKKIKFT